VGAGGIVQDANLNPGAATGFVLLDDKMLVGEGGDLRQVRHAEISRRPRRLRLDVCAAMPHTFPVDAPLLTVVETSAFVRRAEKLLTVEEHEELLFYLALHPLSGDEIPGTGGVRKVRFGARGQGKSGGVRVIYYFFDEVNPLYAIFLYGKNEQVNLKPEQKREVAALAATIKAAAKLRRSKP
jgi:hypothetical protein